MLVKLKKKKNKQTNKSVQETDKKLNINQQLIYVISGNKLIKKKNQKIYHKYLIQCSSFSTIYDSFAGLIFFLMFYLTLWQLSHSITLKKGFIQVEIQWIILELKHSAIKQLCKSLVLSYSIFDSILCNLPMEMPYLFNNKLISSGYYHVFSLKTSFIYTLQIYIYTHIN